MEFVTVTHSVDFDLNVRRGTATIKLGKDFRFTEGHLVLAGKANHLYSAVATYLDTHVTSISIFDKSGGGWPELVATILVDLHSGTYQPTIHKRLRKAIAKVSYTFTEEVVPGLVEIVPGTWRVADIESLHQLASRHRWSSERDNSSCWSNYADIYGYHNDCGLEPITRKQLDALYPLHVTVLSEPYGRDYMPHLLFRIAERDFVKIPNWTNNELWKKESVNDVL
ncbi:hypothetical protein D9M71_399740 [compost metagenome]